MKISTHYVTRAFIALAILIFNLSFFTPSHAQTPLFYGLTSNGGSNGQGTVFTFNITTGNESVLSSFGVKNHDGLQPHGSLVYDATTQLFYGMTTSGGDGYGTLFSFNTTTDKDSVLGGTFGYAFPGEAPNGSLVFDSINNLYYGMTEQGGTDETGTIFSFDPNTNKDTVLYNLAGAPTDGSGPSGDLTYDTNTKLFYGLTEYGGTYGYGTIISFDPSNNTENVLWSFGNGKDGKNPYASFVYDATTKLLYGLTEEGGTSNYGTIITFDPSSNTESVVWSFGSGYDGKYPYGSFVYAANTGLYYAMTDEGGLDNLGAIISFDPSDNSENREWDFGSASVTDGAYPWGDLMYYAPTGMLYGLTSQGGANGNEGAIISYDPIAQTDSVLYSYGHGVDDGEGPYGALVLKTNLTGISTITKQNIQVAIYPNPNNGNFSIHIPQVKQVSELEIFNVLGEKILVTELNSTSTSINLGEQAAGMYLYRVLDEQRGLVGEGKFMVQ